MSLEVNEDTEIPTPPMFEAPPSEEDDQENEAVQESAPGQPPPATPGSAGRVMNRKRGAYVPIAERQSGLAKLIKDNQNKSLKELIESFGSEGSYLVTVERTDPESVFDPVTGRSFPTLGYCGKWENRVIDEDFIEKRFGGGNYIVKFKDKKAGGSGWQYAGQITLKIQGDPNIAEMRAKSGIPTPATTPATNGEHPSVVKEAMAILNKQLDRADDRAKSGGGGDQQMMDLVREQLTASRQETTALRQQLQEVINRPPTEVKRSVIEEKMFSALIDGDSARVTQMRETHRSEVAQLKQSGEEDLKRQQARFDMLLHDAKAAHNREVDAMRTANDVALQAAKSSFETQLAAAKASFDLQKQLFESEAGRLNRELSELRTEVKELRAKKDVSPLEMIKQVEAFKNAVGSGDDEESSTAGKVVEAIANPGTWEGIGAMIESLRGPKAAAAEKEKDKAIQKRQKSRIVKNDKGQRFLFDEETGELKGPLPDKKAKKAESAEPDDGSPKMPEVDPEAMAQTIRFLESSCAGNQDPEVVAQSIRSRVPEELMTAIRDHGVDLVMSKMAKLQSSSPLSSQIGRTWLRKLGKALVGE